MKPSLPVGAVLAIVAIAATTIACTFAFSGLTIDDAFITFRFAHHARLGLGFVWNPGEAPVEGMTSLLWTALLVPFAHDKHATYAWARGLGALANLATLLVWIRIVLRRFDARGAVYPLALLAACCPLLAFHAQNGLETSLAVLCASAMLAAALALIDGEKARFPRAVAVFGVLWLVGGATRPELVAYGACLIACAAWDMDRGQRLVLARRLAVSFVLPGALFFAWRWWYFGHLLPLPFYAKRASGIVSSAGIRYVALTFAGLLGCMALLALLGLSRRFGTLLSASSTRMMLWPALGACASYAAFRPIMGFVYRYPAPFVLPVVIAAAATLARVTERKDAAPWARRIALGLGALGALQLSSTIVPAWHFAHVNSRATRAFHEKFGDALARLPDAGRLATFNDVGGPAFFSGWRTVEGAGLVTPSVSLKGISNRQLVASFDPDVITVSAAEGRIARATDAFPGYRLLRAVPWIVFEGEGPRSYQCVLAREGYAHTVALTQALEGLGVPELPRPWYLEVYSGIKRSFE